MNKRIKKKKEKRDKEIDYIVQKFKEHCLYVCEKHIRNIVELEKPYYTKIYKETKK